MTKRLFMICPTDFIEPIIQEKFDGQKHFYSALGISFTVEQNDMNDLITVIKKHEIEEISFVLSETNKIIMDATQGQKFIDIRGLKSKYQKIIEKRNLTHQMWSTHDHHALFLSYYLNDKIGKLREHLCIHSMPALKVNAKIYSKAYNNFREIYPELSLSDPIRIN